MLVKPKMTHVNMSISDIEIQSKKLLTSNITEISKTCLLRCVSGFLIPACGKLGWGWVGFSRYVIHPGLVWLWMQNPNFLSHPQIFCSDKNGGGTIGGVCWDRAHQKPSDGGCFWSVSTVPSVLLHHIPCVLHQLLSARTPETMWHFLAACAWWPCEVCLIIRRVISPIWSCLPGDTLPGTTQEWK